MKSSEPYLFSKKKSGWGTKLLLASVLIAIGFLLGVSAAIAQTLEELPQVSRLADVRSGSLLFKSPSHPGYRLSPTAKTEVQYTVSGLVARAKVTQTFSNLSQQWLNAVYVFPLPAGAAVDTLSMRIGERQSIA